jgi:two-component system NtrC family response regulator/two-component system response regulator HydG
MSGTVLVVDDQPKPRRLLSVELEEAGFDVVEAADGEEAWRSFCASAPDAVVTDMAMPRCDGLELLRRIRAQSDVPVIVFSGYGSVESAADAFKAGADDFVSSLDLESEELVVRLRRSMGTPEAPRPDSELERRLVGSSAALARVRTQIAGLAPLGAPVLVSGEAGTGRSTAIRALHDMGSTSAGRLLRIDSESFEGPLDDASVRALHLRSVERLSPAAQVYWADLLTRAEGQAFRRGVRVMASTSLPVLPQGGEGSFLPRLRDLLSRFHIDMPPLRYRSEDIPDISRVLVERIGLSVGRSLMRLSPAATEYLKASRLPGNVHQLQQVLERATAFSRGRVIRKQTIQDVFEDLEDSIASMREQRDALEHQRLIQALQETGANISQTAERLGKSRAAIYRMIHKYGIPLTRRG